MLLCLRFFLPCVSCKDREETGGPFRQRSDQGGDRRCFAVSPGGETPSADKHEAAEDETSFYEHVQLCKGATTHEFKMLFTIHASHVSPGAPRSMHLRQTSLHASLFEVRLALLLVRLFDCTRAKNRQLLVEHSDLCIHLASSGVLQSA